MRFPKLPGLVVSCFWSNIGIFLVSISSNSFLLHFHSICFLGLVSYVLGSWRMLHMSLRLIFTPFICASVWMLSAFCSSSLIFSSVVSILPLVFPMYFLFYILYFSILVFLFYSIKHFPNLFWNSPVLLPLLCGMFFSFMFNIFTIVILKASLLSTTFGFSVGLLLTDFSLVIHMSRFFLLYTVH